MSRKNERKKILYVRSGLRAGEPAPSPIVVRPPKDEPDPGAF
jgi:hypothetical protein